MVTSRAFGTGDYSTASSIEGQVRRIDDMLNSLPEKVSKRILGRGMRAGGKVFADLARSRVRIRSGALSKSIRVRLSRRGGITTVLVRAGGKGKWGDAYYSHFVEFGTKRHIIKPKGAKALRFANTLRKEIDHPGIDPNQTSFMRPAYDTGADAAIEEIGRVLRQTLERALK
jgi:HK97 gp10 family phage protein